MGLFDKKEPCAICGGKVKGLFAWQVEGKYICDDCYGVVHIQPNLLNNMTMADFRQYMAFREKNNKLKENFKITRKFDFGFFDGKFVVDEEKNLFCLDADLSSTVFDGGQIDYFVIREDAATIMEGGRDGLHRYASTVPERAMTLAPMVQRTLRELERRDQKDTAPLPNIPEPFEKFRVEIRLKNNPYWRVVTAEMTGPIFSTTRPDINAYLREYEKDVLKMEDLAQLLMGMIDTAAAKECDAVDAAPAPAPAAAPAPAQTPSAPEVDAVSEIKRYKELLDAGIITEEEFTAKKKQLMGI